MTMTIPRHLHLHVWRPQELGVWAPTCAFPPIFVLKASFDTFVFFRVGQSGLGDVLACFLFETSPVIRHHPNPPPVAILAQACLHCVWCSYAATSFVLLMVGQCGHLLSFHALAARVRILERERSTAGQIGRGQCHCDHCGSGSRTA